MEIVKWEQAKQTIAKCTTIDEAKEIRDKAEALRAYAKQQKESIDRQNDLAEIRIRSERRMGEIIKKMPKNRGTQGQLRGSKSSGSKIMLPPEDETPTLSEIGIGKMQSSRLQKIADIPLDEFDEYIKKKRAQKKELTTKGVVLLAKRHARNKDIERQIKDIEEGIGDLPEGLFEVISIDPPWPCGFAPYPEMSLEEIACLEIPAAENCVLWLWTIHKFMRHSFSLLDKWGFEDKAILTWAKDQGGIGRWLISQSEFCIMAIKGNPLINLTNQTTLLKGKRREHSRKPEEFYRMVESLCPGRKLDFFSREKREGWEQIGNEKEKFG